jgi:hypothetical protein
MVAVVRISFILILLMSLFPPWRGRPGRPQSAEEHAGYAFLLAPPRNKTLSTMPPDSYGWVEIRIDGGYLLVQCLIVTSVAGLVASFLRSAAPPMSTHLPVSPDPVQGSSPPS